MVGTGLGINSGRGDFDLNFHYLLTLDDHVDLDVLGCEARPLAEHMSDHIVLCGFGRMGAILAAELERQGEHFIVIENDVERIAEAKAARYLTLSDNATEEDSLVQARIVQAKALVTTLPSDAENVFITLTARNLNPKVMIIARGEFLSTEKKLVQAGADRVVLPAATGALRMAAMITRPSAVELLEVVAGRKVAEVEVDELAIPEGSSLVGLTVRDSQTRTRHGLLIVAVRQSDGKLQFNPDPLTAFESGGNVIVMGNSTDIDRFRSDHRLDVGNLASKS